jgi:hypothetical protein
MKNVSLTSLVGIAIILMECKKFLENNYTHPFISTGEKYFLLGYY